MTLALGIGINSSLYSLASGILRQLPIREVGPRWRGCRHQRHHFDEDRGPFSVPEFLFLREQAQSFSEMAAGDSSRSFNLAESGEPERLTAFQVSPNYFQLVGVTAELGRTLLPGEDRPEQKHVVILSQSLWQRRFGLDPGVIGRAIQLDGEKYTVIGVMPVISSRHTIRLIYGPRSTFGDEQRLPRADAPRDLVVFTRLKPGVAFAQAKAEVQSLDTRYSASLPGHSTGWSASVTSIRGLFCPAGFTQFTCVAHGRGRFCPCLSFAATSAVS
jgi:putative ABC transport system permease protein